MIHSMRTFRGQKQKKKNRKNYFNKLKTLLGAYCAFDWYLKKKKKIK